ncbi:MAG: FtsX-like permease family protein [Candidatus Levybacteria bacterium]|nr:FtsX-like permease family protein [Candidatus Levybacteria bacterium]
MKILKTTWHNIRRSPYQAFAAIFIILQTFFVISIFAYVVAGSAKTISYLESLPQAHIFFRNDADQEDIDLLKKKLEETGKVSEIKFTSQEEALKIYIERTKDEDPLLRELVTASTLPTSFSITAIDPDYLAEIVEMVKTSPIVYQTVFLKDVVSKLVDWTDAIRRVGVILIAFLALDSIFIIVIIINIKISQKKEDINIMRLIGAGGWYIRWPFILEGVSYGIIGAVIGWALSFGALWYSTPLLVSYFKEIPIFPLSWVFLAGLLLGEVLLAIVLGILSSFLAVFRYLK